MTAVLRVKRKNTDTPLDRLVIACKRARTGSPLLEESEPAIQTVVQFAGTLTDPTEDVAQHVAKVMPKMGTEIANVGVKRTCDGSYSGNTSNKKWIGGDPLVERYKVVNCQRSQDTLNEEKSEEKWLTLIDVEDSWSVSNTLKQNAEETEDIEDFVFDLYCGPTDDVWPDDDIWFENNKIMVQEPEYPYLNSEDKSEESSEDSNSESNWRNDYPDTDPDRSRDEDYDSDYSNDDVHLHASREEEDRRIYGRSYAEYRKIIQAHMNDDDSSNNSSNDEGRSSNYSSDESMGLL
ncbi:probable RNA polymerase II nuclear localization protein SLC7A6OS [Cataglyphis hispanica]|uniref:probable RNA polymerase II nuclear localization protein SLC7A6OS n=1 Tax=Cataglyphis hispanica TaxID=1086592 RepID=UPI00217F78A3|nr:probable RNA polymerase II nuclear localization protein SLC7A6OS [Cataglyphis hispanica]